MTQGASVHLRNREGHTPLFLAAAGNAGVEAVQLLRDAGAHLHESELSEAARLHTGASGEAIAVWRAAGVE